MKWWQQFFNHINTQRHITVNKHVLSASLIKTCPSLHNNTIIIMIILRCFYMGYLINKEVGFLKSVTVTIIFRIKNKSCCGQKLR